MSRIKKLRVLLAIVLLFVVSNNLIGQESYSLYQNHTFRHYDRYVYQADYRFHTSVKPFLKRQADSIISLDTLYNIPTNTLAGELIFNRSLIVYDKDNFAFTIDPYINFELGVDKDYDDNSWISTRGFLINASIGKNISISTRFVENQAMFNDYRHDIVKKWGVIPGQGRPKGYKKGGYDYAFSEAYISYQAGKYFNFQFGHGKNFIGDGYRSMLLSDHAFSYPFFKITTDIWNIKYVNLWMQFQDFTQKHPYGTAYDKKWGAFHYLDWSVTKWLNIGFFEAIIWQNADSIGYRGFDINYANPVIFFRPVEFSVGSPDNVLLGFNGKLTLFKKQVFYGQLIIDEFKLSEIIDFENGYWGNKFAIQAGYKTFDLFKIEHLDIQTEFNYVRPYMYSHISSLKNYGHYNVSLAHPLGSNFWESVSFLRYNYKRLFFEGRYSYAKHGTDSAGLNYGNDIYKPYETRVNEYGNYLGQNEPVNLQYASLMVAFLVNPRTNLNIYFNYTLRSESSATLSKNQSFITFGIRTSLQNFYYDY